MDIGLRLLADGVIVAELCSINKIQKITLNAIICY